MNVNSDEYTRIWKREVEILPTIQEEGEKVLIDKKVLQHKFEQVIEKWDKAMEMRIDEDEKLFLVELLMVTLDEKDE